MEDKIKLTCKVFDPHINGNGRVISQEVMNAAVKEYLARPDTKLVYVDKDDSVENPFLLQDAVGTLDHIERKEDNSFIADCTIYTNTPNGRIVGELMDFPEIKNKGFTVKPHGYYDKENDKLTIIDYSIKLQTNDNKGKNNKQT